MSEKGPIIHNYDVVPAQPDSGIPCRYIGFVRTIVDSMLEVYNKPAQYPHTNISWHCLVVLDVSFTVALFWHKHVV